jgi:uncharacterized membrane protein YedE/YeeE
MNASLKPWFLLAIAFGLLLIGFILPLLMVMQIIESTLFLNFFSYGSMTLGSILGFIGVSFLNIRRKKG